MVINYFAFLAHLSPRLMWTILISTFVCRPSSVNFSHFLLLLWNHLAQKTTKLGSKCHWEMGIHTC